VIKWAVLALVICSVLVIARQPLFWKRYVTAVVYPRDELPLSFYEPAELVPGGNQPPAPRETPNSQSLDISALQAAADYAGSHQSRALIVSRHGYIVFERYWQGTSFDTPEEAGPLGRIVAALVAGSAISGRKIGWPDEPIGYLIPEWRNDPRGAITVRNLLQLSSGLAPPARGLGPWSAQSREDFGMDVIGQILQQSLAAPPGSQRVDQSADPDLLALIIERATKQRYAQYVSQVLWRQIGAADAWMSLDRPGGNVRVDRGFVVRQGDWIRVAELLLKNGNYQGDEVLVPRWVPTLLQPARSNPDYGSYIRLGSARVAPGTTPYATSDVHLVGGGGNRLWIVPSLQIAILRTGAPPVSAKGVASAEDWDDARIPNLIIRAVRDFVPPAARPGSDLSKLVPNH
jgi:hypothetical protein